MAITLGTAPFQVRVPALQDEANIETAMELLWSGDEIITVGLGDHLNSLDDRIDGIVNTLLGTAGSGAVEFDIDKFLLKRVSGTPGTAKFRLRNDAAATNVFDLPLTTGGTTELVSINGSQLLQNKTLSSPTITNGASMSGEFSITNSSFFVKTKHIYVASAPANTATTIDTEAVTNARAIEYLIVASSTTPGEYISTKVLVIQDGAKAYLTEYAVLSIKNGSETPTITMTVSSDVSGGSVVTTVTPNMNVSISAVRTAVK